MGLSNAKKDIEIYRACVGNTRQFLTSHRNEVLNGDFAAINKNIQISIAKLEDVLTERLSKEGSNESD